MRAFYAAKRIVANLGAQLSAIDAVALTNNIDHAKARSFARRAATRDAVAELDS